MPHGYNRGFEVYADGMTIPSAEPTPPKRRSRMRRAPTGKRIELTARDIELFKLLHRHPYLRSTFLYAFLGGASETRFKERLGHLYHDGGYIDRPAQQWRFADCRYMPVVYELGEAGERVLRDLGLPTDGSPSRRSRMGASRQFAHTLMVSDIVASIELGVRADASLRFVSWPEILARAPEATRRADNPFAVPVSISYRPPRMTDTRQADIRVVPDAMFGLEYAREGKKAYRFFALEADRNSMPVARSTLQQSSYLRKILSYTEIIGQGLHKSHFGVPNLLVLTVATSERHMQGIMKLIRELGCDLRPFLFKALPPSSGFGAPAPMPEILTAPWLRADGTALQICQ